MVILAPLKIKCHLSVNFHTGVRKTEQKPLIYAMVYEQSASLEKLKLALYIVYDEFCSQRKFI